MAVIRISGFLGENRALHPLLLPDGVGVTSLNQKPGRGDFRPWKQAASVATVPSGRGTIYRMGRDVASDTNYWLSWPGIVHAVRGFNSEDSAEKTYFTGSGTPKWTNTAIGLAFAPYPSTTRELGVPAPVSACTLTSSVADPVVTTETVTLSLTAVMINIASATFKTSTAHGIDTDKTITLTAAYNDGTARTYTATVVATPTAADTVLINSVPPGAVGTYGASGTLTYSKSTTAPAPDKETRFYTYTYVTDDGAESAPAPPSAELTCEVSSTVTLANLSAPPSGNFGINRIRIYRTQAGTAGNADFFFCSEVSSSQTTATDAAGTILGEVLPTTTWLMPPADLTFLTGMWNGMMAGLSGRSIRFCEAFTPYAWPLAYEVLPSHSTPVALVTFGQTLVVLTNGNPLTLTGGSPDAMDEQPVEFGQACVAPASAVSLGFGVAWASPDGLAFIGSGGARLLTDGVLTRDDWQAMNPATMVGCMYERRYVGFYTVGGVRKGFVLDPANPQGIYFLSSGYEALYVDDLQDSLYVLDGVNVKEWDTGATMVASFRSKIIHHPKPVTSFACGEVTADSYPVTLRIDAINMNADEVAGLVAKNAALTAPTSTSLRFTKTVTSRLPFRLPGGFAAADWQIEVEASGAVQGVAVAHSMAELAQV